MVAERHFLSNKCIEIVFNVCRSVMLFNYLLKIKIIFICGFLFCVKLALCQEGESDDKQAHAVPTASVARDTQRGRTFYMSRCCQAVGIVSLSGGFFLDRWFSCDRSFIIDRERVVLLGRSYTGSVTVL